MMKNLGWNTIYEGPLKSLPYLRKELSRIDIMFSNSYIKLLFYFKKEVISSIFTTRVKVIVHSIYFAFFLNVHI